MKVCVKVGVTFRYFHRLNDVIVGVTVDLKVPNIFYGKKRLSTQQY